MKPALTLFALLSLFASNTHAGPFTDKLSICLIEKTTQADKNKLIKWIFGAMSSHPIVKDLSNIPRETSEQLSRDTANLFMELLTVRCRAETEKAVQYESDIALQTSFSILGKVAMQGIMSDPSVAQYLGELDNYIDKNKLNFIKKQ